MDRKLDLVVQELRRYGVSAFRSRNGLGMMYGQQMDIHSLHSGRPLPSDGLTATKNEGVGIALDEKAALAWKSTGKVWEAVSSRLVTMEC